MRQLFPSARNLENTWHSVVKIGQSLYIEAPGMDPFRPDQATPVPNFFLAGSYTKQDYIDSMEGATLSGVQDVCTAGAQMHVLSPGLVCFKRGCLHIPHCWLSQTQIPH